MWDEYFAPHYKQISISELTEESNCTLCGHPIYKSVGVIKRTGAKVVNCKGVDFSIPDVMLVGCDCYGIKSGSSLTKIIEKLQAEFPGLVVKLYDNKIMLLDLLSQLSKIQHNSYKIMIPVRYLYCSNYEKLMFALNRSQYNYFVKSNKCITGWGKVVFKSYEKPLKRTRITKIGDSNLLETYFTDPYYEGSVVIINSDVFTKI